ncbi:MAG: carboxypeptidase regulatory-like domain-containing protein, partial [Armatimonadetes bacterium]|nr:carboxypeptidase regulatory-like domain-containing protein [Armatimonadota bacterium]
MRTRLVGMLAAVVVLGSAGWADVTGQVVDPEGQPVAGAKVEAASFDWPRTGLARSTTHADGSFVMRLSRPREGVVAAASAPGWGLGWRYCALPVDGLRIQLALATELRLPVVDEHGQPVVGLAVRVYGVWAPERREPYRIPHRNTPVDLDRGADPERVRAVGVTDAECRHEQRA